jgi:hypothetical protein
VVAEIRLARPDAIEALPVDDGPIGLLGLTEEVQADIGEWIYFGGSRWIACDDDQRTGDIIDAVAVFGER